MSGDKRITVELTEAEARRFLDITAFDGAEVGVVRDKIAAALPPEYPEGTFARVTHGVALGRTYFAEMVDGYWSNADGEVIAPWIGKVEPIRTLADDEIAIKVSPAFVYPQNASAWQSNANYMRQQGHGIIADLCERYAQAIALALEADARS